MSEQPNVTEMELPDDNITPKAIGIGGIFFFVEDTEKTREWYSQNLGIESNQYGATFESRNILDPAQIDSLQWSPFKKGSNYFKPSNKEFMINYRVQHIEALVEKLKANGVAIVDNIETYEYGKFVHILDLDGTKIELWEPVSGFSF